MTYVSGGTLNLTQSALLGCLVRDEPPIFRTGKYGLEKVKQRMQSIFGYPEPSVTDRQTDRLAHSGHYDVQGHSRPHQSYNQSKARMRLPISE